MDNLKRAVETRGYPLGIAATADGTVLASVGSPAGLESDDLRRLLFGSGEAIATLYASLEGQPLPRIWAQGPVRCAVYRPAPDTVVGIFVRSDANNVQLYREFAALTPELSAGLA